MANLANNHASDSAPVSHNANVYLDNETLQLVKRMKMTGTVELDTLGAGQIYPSKQDR